MKQSDSWRQSYEAGEVSLEDAAAGHVHGLSAPAEQEERSYALEVFDAETDAACYGADRSLAKLMQGLALSRGEYERLLAAGADRVFLANLNIAADLGTARVSLSARGTRFELGGPDPRLLLGVRDAAFQLVDLVALASHDENQWSLLHGLHDMLGAWWIEEMHRRMCTERPARLRLFATPWGWLRGGGAGVCVLEWTGAAVSELRLLGERCTLVVDPGGRDRLRAVLKRGGLPLVVEDRDSVGRVA